MRNIVWHIHIAYGVLKNSKKQIPRNHIYIYICEEYRVAYPNCIWCFEENPKTNSTISHIYIYMRNIVWHIQVLQKAETFIILEGSGCQKLKHSPFCRVPCLPKAYRNQANTPSLGIALWNICGISKSVLLRAFEALGAAV